MIETSGVIEKEQGNGFYLVTLEQPAGHQCRERNAAAGPRPGGNRPGGPRRR
ncbi:MAG: hypothetical protein NTW02_03610 [Cyanobium sp. LacPavin_0920_WC12_MAG_62_9]|nr:hypothetical protein [Cyanobium sp. LacPavin_0920_WC12_MAG_62_9]